MSNRLKMAIIQEVLQLHARRWSFRRIAQELHIDRGTVSRYVRLNEAKPATEAPTGVCSPVRGSKPAKAPTGSEMARSDESGPLGIGDLAFSDSKPASEAPTGSEGTIPDLASAMQPAVAEFCARQPQRTCRSACEPHRELILAKLGQGLSAMRIFQDLAAEQNFQAKYHSVRRYVALLSGGHELPMRRMESLPGVEAQVDFGAGAPVITAEGKQRKTNVFRIVLSHSRKAYSEATFTQTAEDFIRCLENAFGHFGGVPETLVVDNLKAAVRHPDWFDPVLNPKLQSFAQHYGTVILPTKPYMPRHKGKVESGVKYVKNNALKSRKFASLEGQNQHLLDWETNIADTRIHGTLKRQVGKLFQEAERTALLPLPSERFPFFHEAQRKVSRDGHIEVAKAYYSVPPEYLGREVWVRWDARLVRIFNHRFDQIAVHVRHEPGRFSTLGQHLSPKKINGLERGAAYLLNQVQSIGPQSHQWAQAMVHARGIEGTRPLQGLLALAKKHASSVLEKACETALSHGAFRLQTLRKLLARSAEKQQPLPFLDEHPIIRPLDDYAAVVARAIHRQANRPSVGEGFGRHGWTKVCPSSLVPARSKENPGSEVALARGSAETLPPRSDYPSPGCSSAEPDSVLPDSTSIVPPSSFHQFPFQQE
jgi:transposase